MLLLLLLMLVLQTTIQEPSPDDQQSRWLKQEVERLADKSQGLEEQLQVAQSAAMAMASKIEQLEVSDV